MRLFLTLVLFLFAIQCTQKAKPISELVSIEQGPVVREIGFIGRIRSERTSLVRAPIDAQLVKLNVGLGSTVAAGDAIAVIEQPKDDSRVTGAIQDKGRIEQLRLRKNQAQVRLESAQKEVSRLARLVQSGSIASNEYETAQVNQQMLVKEIESIDAEEKTIVDTVSARKVISRNATRTLYAAGSGTVTQLWTMEDNITAGMTIAKDTVIATIEQSGQYVLKGEVVEADYIRMKLGQAVEVSLVHGTNESAVGSIKSISPMARQDQFGIGRFDVTASFGTGISAVKTGLEARGRITLAKKEKAHRLPRSAIRQYGNEYRVSIPGQTGALFKAIKVGLVGDQFIEVTEGLDANQKVYKSYVEPSP